MLIQQFMPQIVEQGEWSLVFFDKQFSHAFLKQPKAGDFRVQNDFGGTIITPPVPDTLIEQAARILHDVDSPLLYARVDGVDVEGQFMLMELELIEPALGLDLHPDAARNFTDAIQRLIRLEGSTPME
jgi:hypothetical protein